MKKLWKPLVATMLAAAMCVPVLAVEPEQTGAWKAFPDVSENWAYQSIQYCCENELFQGGTDGLFHPTEAMKVDQAIALASRLYSLTHGGNGIVPELPHYTAPYARFLTEDGIAIAELTVDNGPKTYNAAARLYVGLSETPDDDALPQTCTVELGLQGYGEVKTFSAVRETHTAVPGVMNQGYSTGTGYRVEDDSASELFLNVMSYAKEIPPFARVYDGDGKLIKEIYLNEAITYSGVGGGFYIALSNETDDPAISSETCTMEVGFEGYADGVKTYEGARKFYEYSGGHMSYGMRGTGYTFDAAAGQDFGACFGCGEIFGHYSKDDWWAKNAFYLTYHTGFRVDGGVIYRLVEAGVVTQEERNDDILKITEKFSQYNADRMMFACLVDVVTKDQQLEAINKEATIPDMDMTFAEIESSDVARVLRLYRAGIFTGVDDEGSFGGDKLLTREQAATILARVLKPELRISVTKTK